MDCREAGRALSALADGELAPESVGDLEAHLAGCRECARAARVLEAVRGWFDSLPRPGAPDGIRDGVLARIRRPESRLLTLIPVLRLAAAAAGILMLGSAAATFLVKPGRLPAPGFYSEDEVMAMIARDHAPDFGPKEMNR